MKKVCPFKSKSLIEGFEPWHLATPAWKFVEVYNFCPPFILQKIYRDFWIENTGMFSRLNMLPTLGFWTEPVCYFCNQNTRPWKGQCACIKSVFHVRVLHSAAAVLHWVHPELVCVFSTCACNWCGQQRVKPIPGCMRNTLPQHTVSLRDKRCSVVLHNDLSWYEEVEGCQCHL